jgi:hypothetical protein
MKTLAQLAREFAQHFETRETDDRAFLHADAPQWARDIVFRCHGDGATLPNDWVYTTVSFAADRIADAVEEGGADSLEDVPSDIAEALADIYTGRLLRWMMEYPPALGAVDDVLADGNVDPTVGVTLLIQAAQYECIRGIAATILGELRELCAY